MDSGHDLESKKYIIDTYVWIDYFRGLANQELEHRIDREILYTPTIVLAELKKKYVEDNEIGFKVDLEIVRSKSSIINLDETTAIRAGEIRATTNVENIGSVDWVLIASAEINNSKVLTGDPHFKGLENSVLIEDLDGG